MIFLFSDNMSNVKDTDEVKQLPTCVGFIMDGNRRWATEQGLDAVAGHRAGAEVFERMVRDVCEANIPHAVFYVFSTENWQRSEFEVTALMMLFTEMLQKDSTVRVRVIGDVSRFPNDLQEAIKAVEEKTKELSITIWLALSYGGRQEILSAVNKAIAEGKTVTEKDFTKLLYTDEMPDPDLIIRTGGEQRLSNFLPWQSTYSELIFTSTYWPAFTKAEFLRMLEEYAKRQRRHGK